MIRSRTQSTCVLGDDFVLFDVVLSNLISERNDFKYPLLIHNCGYGF